MTNSLTTHLSQSVSNSDSAATVCAEEAVAESGTTARLGDELFRHLPADRRSSAASISLAEAAYKITGDRLDCLFQACAALAASQEAFFLTTFATLLARLAGQEVVTLRNSGGDPTPLVLTFDPETSFRAMLWAAQNAQAPTSDQPCAAEFVFASSRVSFAGLPSHCLRMAVHATEGETHIRLASTTGLWDQTVLCLWLRYFDCLLAAAAAAPDVPWKTLPLLDESDAQEFYLAFNHTAVAYPADVCVHELVLRRIEQVPDALAIASESQRFTYRQLHEYSDAIARHLRSLGAGPGRPVAVCIERSAELPVALLAVLKAGSCYVPLVPQESRQRLVTILDECRPVALIVDRSFSQLQGDNTIPHVYLDDIPPSSAALDYRAGGLTPDHHAYMIYTSGTTGKPKGVMIPHRALANFLHAAMCEPGFTALDRLLAVSPISFDIATMEVFLPLAAGGTLVVGDRFIAADPLRLAATIKRLDITVQQASISADGLYSLQFSTAVSSLASGLSAVGQAIARKTFTAIPGEIYQASFQVSIALSGFSGATYTAAADMTVILQMSDGSTVNIAPSVSNTFSAATSGFVSVSQQFTIPTPSGNLTIVSAQAMLSLTIHNSGTAALALSASGGNSISVCFDSVGLALVQAAPRYSIYGRMVGSSSLPFPVRFAASKLPEFSDLGFGDATKLYGTSFALEEV